MNETFACHGSGVTESVSDLLAFAVEFREGLIGSQPKASRGMCALVSIPLRAALKVIRGIDTELVTENGHTYLVTSDGKLKIDPTVDQFRNSPVGAKVLIEDCLQEVRTDERLSGLPFDEVIGQFKRLYSTEGKHLGPKEAGTLVAQYIFYPLAQRGFFEERME